MPLKIILILAEVGGPPSCVTGCLGRKEEQQPKVFTFSWEALHTPVPFAELWALVCVRTMGGTIRFGGGPQGLETWLGKLNTFIFMLCPNTFNTLSCPGQDSSLMSHTEKLVLHKKVKQDISHRRQSYNTALLELYFILNNEIVSTVCCDEQLHLPNLLLSLLSIKGSEDLLIFQAFSVLWWRWVCILSHSLLLYYPSQ